MEVSTVITTYALEPSFVLLPPGNKPCDAPSLLLMSITALGDCRKKHGRGEGAGAFWTIGNVPPTNTRRWE